MSLVVSTKFHEPTTPSEVAADMGEFPMSQSFMNLSIEEQELKKEEWRKELAEVNSSFHPEIIYCQFPNDDSTLPLLLTD